MAPPSSLRIVVYGASGHGKVVTEVVRSAGGEVLGFVDDGKPVGTVVLGLPVLGGLEWLLRQTGVTVAPAIGANARRLELCDRVAAAGLTLGTFVHERAWVSPTASLGAGTIVMAGAVVNAEARVGRGVILNTGCVVEHECVVGDGAHLSPNATLGGQARVGARSHVGLGAGVLPLIEVEADCVVGAGAVVRQPRRGRQHRGRRPRPAPSLTLQVPVC